MKHYNIPVFVPHYGCPFSCVFCNQKEITGQSSATDIEDADDIIRQHLSTISSGETEIAFFGGSFTAIPEDIMISYLELGYKYVKSGRVSGIRISTRPDFINNEVLTILKNFGVTVIELGAQSFCDDVLKKSGRGHKASDTINACDLIKNHGFKLGIQLMTGLPGDTFEKSVYSAEVAASIMPDCVRIYPTLVISDTPLCRLYNQGLYAPQSLDEAVKTVGSMLNIFKDKNIPVIRVGLASVSEMNSRGSIVAGPDHPALRELCEGQAYLNILTDYLKNNPAKNITVISPLCEHSKIIGHKKTNYKFLLKNYGIRLSVKSGDIFKISAE